MQPWLRAWPWVLSGVLAALGMPNRNLHIPGLALVCLAPFLAHVFRNQQPLRAGTQTGMRPKIWRQALGLWLIAGAWVFVPDVWSVQAILAPWEIIAGFVVAPLVPLYFVAATVLSLRLSAQLPLRPLAIATIWTAWDALWGVLRLPLPLHFGASIYDLRWLVQIADITGIYGVTFVVILANATLASSFVRAWRPLRAGALILALVLLYGGLRTLPEPTSRFNIGAIQPLNWLVPERSWEIRQQNYENLQNLSLAAIGQGAELIVWPEGAARAQLTQFGLQDYLITPVIERLSPADGLIAGSSEPQDAQTFINAALLYNGNGSLIDRYGKQWVFPIFETGRGIAADRAGYAPLRGGVRLGALGTMICLESVLPQASRALTQAGAESLVVISEDIWFGNSNWPMLHGVLSVFRAVENRRDFVFVNNTGGNIVVEATGRIRAWGDYWQPDAVVAPLGRRTDLTFYSRYGDVFAIATLSITALLILRATVQARQSSQSRQ